jgi:hypothetical protein
MGFDLRYLPVHLDCVPMKRIREDPELRSQAIEHPPFSKHVTTVLPEISQQLQAELPHGWRWGSCYPDRTQNQVEYLLDPPAYRCLDGWSRRKRSMPYRIVYGDECFAPQSTGGQGSPWRCSSNAFLREAVTTLGNLDIWSVTQEFSPQEMITLGLYQTHPGQVEDSLDRLLTRIEQLQSYYWELVDQDLDLLVIADWPANPWSKPAR